MDTIFRTTTPIRYRSEEGHATGFFYRTDDQLYLVTNRHVVFELKEDTFIHKPDSLMIRIRSSENPKKTRSYEVELYEQDQPVWMEHPHHHVDVVAIPLDIDLGRIGNKAFGPKKFLSKNFVTTLGLDSVRAGKSAVVAGYPIIDSNTYAPVLRDALISSPLSFDFDKEPYFLIDAKLHEGTSGSPVLAKRRSGRGQINMELLGVHSGRYDVMRKGSENINRVWYARLINQIVEAEKPSYVDRFD